MRYFILTASVFLLIMFSCSSDDAGPLNAVQLRIHNQSSHVFEEIYVGSSGDSQTYGPLMPGLVSEYKSFDLLYRYAYIRITTNSKEYILQPIDFVGETPLPAGRYTYALGIDDADYTYSVSLELQKD